MSKLGKAVAVLYDGYRSMSLREYLGFLRLLLFRDDRILIYSTALLQPDVVDRKPDRRVSKGQLADLAAERGKRTTIPWELQCDVYDGVRDFFVHVDNGTLGHISWLYYKDDPNRILRLEDGECEIKFCLTFPEFRGKGIYPAALVAIQHYLRSRGYSRCFVCVMDDNAASIRGIEKAGFVRVGAMRWRKVLGVQIGKPWATRQLERVREDERWTA